MDIHQGGVFEDGEGGGPGDEEKKVEGNEYSKIIEWLYNLSKNENTWGIDEISPNELNLRKRELYVKQKEH